MKKRTNHSNFFIFHKRLREDVGIEKQKSKTVAVHSLGDDIDREYGLYRAGTGSRHYALDRG